MVIFLLVFSFLHPKSSMATISMWPFTFPKTTCLPSNCSVLAVQMKSREPLCWVQRLPWVKFQDPCPSGWNSHHQISSHRWTCCQSTMACEVTTLAHISQNNSVKAGIFIIKSFLPSSQNMNTFCYLWNFICHNSEIWPKGSLSTAMEKAYGGVDPGWAPAALGCQHFFS